MSDAEFLREAARYFSKRPTNGEDKAYWANAYNAENCLRIAAHIERIEALNRELVEAAADGLHEIDAAIRCVTDEATKAEMQAVGDRLRAALKANLPEEEIVRVVGS